LELENFKPLFVKRKNIYLQDLRKFQVLKKIGSENRKSENRKKRGSPQIANLQNWFNCERSADQTNSNSLQLCRFAICGNCLQTALNFRFGQWALICRGGQVRNLFRYAHFRNLRNKEICCGCAL
jgi:hypothetical protein